MHVLLMMSSVAMGGAERTLVSAMPYLLAEGLDISLCTLNTRRDSPLVEAFAQTGVQRYDLEAKRMINRQAWMNFVNLLREKQFDLLHAQDQDTIIYAGLAHRRHGIPTVMTRHVLVEPTYNYKKLFRANAVLLSARFGFNRVLTVSEAVRQDFSKRARIPLSRIETVYNGLNVEKFKTQHQRDAKRAELNWQAEDKIAIMVAVMRPGKGHEVLFESIPQLTTAVPNIKIKLVGDGELADDLRQQAAPYGDTVEFLGQRMDVPELLGASDMLVLPSWSEALPTVLLEAGAAGLPVVATDVGGAKEIVVDTETGYIIPAGDVGQLAERTIHLLNHPAEAQAMGQAAQARVSQHFSLERQAQHLKQIYERVLAEARK